MHLVCIALMMCSGLKQKSIIMKTEDNLDTLNYIMMIIKIIPATVSVRDWLMSYTSNSVG